MLKIKDNIDLKELEKFGFEYNDDYKQYVKSIKESDCDLIVSNDKVVYHCNYMTADMNCNAHQLVVEIYDLIKAGLIEKVGE